MKILVTGFEPFGPWQRNPSGETARHLDGSTIIDAEITTLPSLCSICYETPSQSNVIEMTKLVQVIQPGLPAPVLSYVICHLCPHFCHYIK